MSGGSPSAGAYGRRLALVLLAAAACRAGVFVWAEIDPGRFEYPDTQRYLRVARHIVAGDGPIESASIRAGTDPLYPYLLAGAMRLGAASDAAACRAARVVQALAGVLTVWLAAALARRWHGEAAALLAAAILAVDPITLFFHGLVLTEVVFTALLMAALMGVARLGDRPPIDAEASATAGAAPGVTAAPVVWALTAGAALGLATLTRGTGLLLPICLVPFVWHFAAGGAARWRLAIVCLLLLAFGAVVSPNVSRNYRLFGRFIPARVGGGASLLEALGPWADGGPGMDRIVYPPVAAGADEAERDAAYRRAAVAWARDHPGRAASLALSKLRRTWSITINAPGYGSRAYQAVGWLTVAPVFALALAGVVALRCDGWRLAYLLMPAAYFSLVHAVFVGSVRYRVPAMPMIVILAAVGLSSLFCLDRYRRSV